jgi:transcriptional regulator with XRE-family HTH domain
MNSNDVEIGQRIRHCRRLTGLSMREICDRNMISVGTYSQWERGEVAITDKNIFQCIQIFLSEGINCTAQWLLMSEGECPTLLQKSARHYPEKFFEREIAKISPEIMTFLDIKSYQKNNPGAIVHQVKNRAMLPIINVGDFVGGKPLERTKINFAHREMCILEMEPKKYIVRTFYKQKNYYVLVAANTSASVVSPLIIKEPPISVIPIEFFRKSTIPGFDKLDDGEDV